MNILVTGGGGYKGTILVEKLLLNKKVKKIVVIDTFWFGNESGIVELIESAGGDILKKDFLKSYGKPIKTAYRHIDNAVKSGLIEKDGKHLVLVE